jgi:hypothetical protein
MSPQVKLILKHMISEGSITPIVAATLYKIRSLPRRISDIEHFHKIKVKRELRTDATGQRYAYYTLSPEQKELAKVSVRLSTKLGV